MKRGLTIGALVVASILGLLFGTIEIFVRRFNVDWDDDPLATPLWEAQEA